MSIQEEQIFALHGMQSPCVLCPRKCGALRSEGQRGYCGTTSRLIVADSAPHFGEEKVLVGIGGSGTIFIAGCNLGCVFCQNCQISHGSNGSLWEVEDLVYAMLRLQERGSENINFVTPTHHAPQIAEAVLKARHRGLSIPTVYNCGGYESVETLRLLSGVIDIYMPDFKFWSEVSSERYAEAADYPDRTRRALLEMYHQVGDLRIIDEVAIRGLLVRHLVMPGLVDEGRQILDFLARDVSPNTYVNIMGQYRPSYLSKHFPEINRPTGRTETEDLRQHARQLGLRLAD